MANGDYGTVPVTSSAFAEAASLLNQLIASRQSLPKETSEALEYRYKKGYKPVNIQEKFIDVGTQEEFDKYKRALTQVPSDPETRNKMIQELGYRPVLRYTKRDIIQEPTQVKKLVPRKKYELSFTTMPDKKIQLGSEEEFNQASLVNEIDRHLGSKYKEKFDTRDLDASNAYKAYTTADPQRYNKLFLNEQERNTAIMDYAKSKGLDPNQTLNMYIQNRDKYYPTDLLAGKEELANRPSSTLYGYRNYLTTMEPKVSTFEEEVVEPGVKNVEKTEEVTYPFKFGYKGTSPERPTTPAAPKRRSPDGGCIGGICEKAADIYEGKTKYLYKRSKGGVLKKATRLLY